MKSVSRVKVVIGYTLLLGVLFFSLFFVRKEVESLMRSDDRDVQWTDSLISLLREKDINTINMLRTLNETSDSMVSTREIENIIATQKDTTVTKQLVQRRIITHRDTVVTKPKNKGFLRRLGEVFVPPKKDTAIQVKTSLEFATDTVVHIYNPVDSLQEKLRAVAQQKKDVNTVVQRRKRTLQRTDKMLTARIDSLLKGYEQETLQRALAEAEYQQSVRRHSIRTISRIAIGAVLLSAFFLIIIGRDITRSNRYRRELEEARRRAEDLLAMREKMMLAITHDFKAPLGSIMGYADLLSRLTVDERQHFYLNNMKTSSEHLLKLVVDLLDFHRLDLHKADVNRVTFHPARLLEEIHVSFEPLTAAKGLALHCQLSPELEGAFISDPLRLRQIINNLLSNAVKFTEQGSITMTAHYQNRQLIVAITDTGKGMDPADRERIFQEFTRLPGAQGQEGFGLGLSIVRMLVQLLEGTIEVDSVPGKGSTFTLSIPLYVVNEKRGNEELRMKNEEQINEEQINEEQINEELRMKNEELGCAVTPNGNSSFFIPHSSLPSPNSSFFIPHSSLPSPNSSFFIPHSSFNNFLLIDDDRIQLSLTAAMLQQSGIASVSCLQLDELLEALRTDTFDVLLTDVQMPVINGFELLKLLRASNIPQAKTIPVIAVTARSDMKPEEFTAHGFAGCLHKPFTVAELFEVLQIEEGTLSGNVQGDFAMQNNGADSPSSYRFSALTTFSEDDPEASRAILESFVSETRLNATRLQQAVEAQDADEIAAVAHKMIPLFTLINATELVELLRQLEAQRGNSFGEAMKETASAALNLIEDVIEKTL